jgi:hypothetical protein
MKDAFVLIKDLRTQQVRAFLDYVYKGEVEFAGTTEVFCEVMSDWIDFSLLSISESETCQILANATSKTKQKTEFSKSMEEENNHSDNILCPNMKQQENILEKGETTQQRTCNGSVHNSGNLENASDFDISSVTTERLKQVVS